jgi:hypothetical protein
MLRSALTTIVLVWALPAFAQTVVDQDFVFLLPGPSYNITQSATVLPFVKDGCYHWRLRLDKTKASVQIVEKYTMPVAPTNWRPEDLSTLSTDGRTSTHTHALIPDEDGWIENGWCMDTGDPLGLYTFEIRLDGRLIGTFPFQITGSD